MLCDVYGQRAELPANRGQLLAYFVAVRLAWEHERHADPATWVAADVQAAALAQLAYAITASRGRGTSVAWRWAQRRLRKGAPSAAPERVRELARAADLLDVLDDGRALRFSHQLVQEYFAARTLQQKIAQALRWRRLSALASWWQLRRYAAPGRRTGWEETLLLLVGIEGEDGNARALIRGFLSQPLQAGRLLLASGAETDPALLDEVRQALHARFLDTGVPREQRLAVGEVLSAVNGARPPVTPEAWRHELAQRTERFGAPAGYWCSVPGGVYTIGGWEADQQSADISLPAFWVARFPITVAQYAPFVAAGYGMDAEGWWTPNGWRWKQEQRRTQPWRWNKPTYDGANQPAIGVTWYEATAFCAWLTEQLADALPAGYVVRLPSEAEWEATATYDANGQRRRYSWGDEAATPERAIYNASGLEAPAPVGCCPAGAAACGALDMAGNVWEWCASSYRAYPRDSATSQKGFTDDSNDVPLRGASYHNDSTFVRCGARFRSDPDSGNFSLGFRVVLAPRSH